MGKSNWRLIAYFRFLIKLLLKPLDLYKNLFFRFGFGFSFLLSLLSVIVERGNLHLFINQFHSPIADVFFKYITHLGDGFVFLALGLLLLIIKGKIPFFQMLTAAVLTLIVVGVLKKWVFPDFDRPLLYLGKEAGLHLVEGVKMNLKNSFPSGHTTAAFAAWGLLAYHFPKASLPLLLLAAFIAFSRVYLSQHFFMDLALGSFLGMLITYFSIKWVEIIEKQRTLKR